MSKIVKKLVNGNVYIDNSDLNSLVMGELIYCGIVRIYVEPEGEKVYLAKELGYNPDKRGCGEPESDVESFIFSLGMLDDSFLYWAYVGLRMRMKILVLENMVLTLPVLSPIGKPRSRIATLSNLSN